jgi:hypothetical protein
MPPRDDAPMSNRLKALLAVLTIAVIAGAALFWWQRQRSEPVAQPAPAAPATPASAPQPAPAPAIAYPLAPPTAAEPMRSADIGSALADLLGRKAVLSFFQLDDFARRFVATVDNLGRAHAPPAAWPVNPTPGRFTVQAIAGTTVIAPDNSARYTPFVLLCESVDSRRAVDLYVRMYPLLQASYEELGFPKSYFNDRLIAVIDQLLATPDREEPLKLELTDVKGPIPSDRPWVRYQFADPELESLSAGQKILLRVGPVNGRRLKARLAEIRAELVRRAVSR